MGDGATTKQRNDGQPGDEPIPLSEYLGRLDERGDGTPLDVYGNPVADTNHLSPMGQVDDFGRAVRSGLAAGGWRRRALKIFAWTMIAIPAIGLLLAAFGD